MRRTFNREYHIRATRQALRAAGAEAFYRPAERPNPVAEPQAPRRPRSRVNKEQLAFAFPAWNQDEPLKDLFPEAYS